MCCFVRALQNMTCALILSNKTKVAALMGRAAATAIPQTAFKAAPVFKAAAAPNFAAR